MSTPAIHQAEAAGVDFTVHEFESTPGVRYGADAAASLGLPLERVFKTLMVQLDGAHLVVAVLPVADELDLKRLASTAGAKRAALAPPRLAERSTGYVLGGISPLGQRRPHPTFLDESALDFETIYVSGGRRGLELELRPGDLQSTCDARIGALARSPALS